jgi:RNA polymerase sigma-70 factor (ECF subfamily)
LLRSVQEPLFLRIRAIVRHHEAAEDVLQDVFILIHGKLGWLREPRHFRAWAFRIDAREAFLSVAKDRRRPGANAVAALGGLEDPTRPDPLRAVEKERMPGLVGDLPAGSRAVLTLHYLDDLPLTEVADVLGLPVGTVKSRLSYGLRLLRERLNIDE